MRYEIPKAVSVNGEEYEIRWDYRAILDIIAAMNDPELSDQDKALAALDIFYPGFYDMPQEGYQEAIQQLMEFINCGEEVKPDAKKAPRLMDWEQDFPYIAAPINRVLGREIRESDPLHWWTFVSAYREIGDCLFAQIVRIREKKAKGKKLDKMDKEFYKNNRELVDFKTVYTEAEKDLLSLWT